MSLCSTFSTAEVCFNDGTSNQTLVAHYEYVQGVLQAIRYANAAGIPVDTSAGTVTVGACSVLQPAVETKTLCDRQADGSVIEFCRRTVIVFNPDASTASTTVTDLQLDGQTSYVVTGVPEECSQCPEPQQLGIMTSWT